MKYYSRFRHLAIERAKPPPTDAQVATIEALLGATLPASFREFLQVANGGYVEYTVDVPLRDGKSEPISFSQIFSADDVALQISALRERAGLSQRDLARKLKTSQQQISRLESPGYEGHSLSTLRRVAKALGARLRVVLEPYGDAKAAALAEGPVPYRVRRRATRNKVP